MNSVEGNMAEKCWGETLRDLGTCLGVCQSILSPSPESSISSHYWLWPMKGEGDPIRAPKDFWGALAFHQSVSSNSAVSLQCVWVRHLILKFRVAFLRQGLWEVIRVKWGQECGGLHDDPGGFGGRGRETWDGTFSLSCLACVASSVPDEPRRPSPVRPGLCSWVFQPPNLSVK